MADGSVRPGHGGSEVFRSSRGVHRSAGPWTPTVHAFLSHVRAQGFGGAPEVLGFDEEGREVLSYIEGEVLGDPAWVPGVPTPWPEYARSEDALVAAARLLRAAHDAAASFRPSGRPVWKQYRHGELLPGEIVCHGDVGPHNTVYRGGLPVALIDWETIRPDEPAIEFGNAAWAYVPLGDEQYFEQSDFPTMPDLPRRLALFARAYGITDRSTVAWAVQQAKQRSVEALRFFPVDAGQGAAYLRVRARELSWLARAQERLYSSLP